MIGKTTPLFQSGRTLLASAALLATLAISGCGGGSTSSATARIRAVNCCPNGGSATIYVNAGSANGSQNFEQASSYLYIAGGDSIFSYLLSSYQTLTPPGETRILSNGDAYSIVLVGRADVPTSDFRFDQLELLTDTHSAPPAGDAYVRVMNAAPDAGSAAVSLGASSSIGTLSYPLQTSFVAVPAGSTLVSITPSGSAAVRKTTSFVAGHAYTVFLTEPTVSTTSPAVAATYDIFVLDDDV